MLHQFYPTTLGRRCGQAHLILSHIKFICHWNFATVVCLAFVTHCQSLSGLNSVRPYCRQSHTMISARDTYMYSTLNGLSVTYGVLSLWSRVEPLTCETRDRHLSHCTTAPRSTWYSKFHPLSFSARARTQLVIDIIEQCSLYTLVLWTSNYSRDQSFVQNWFCAVFLMSLRFTFCYHTCTDFIILWLLFTSLIFFECPAVIKFDLLRLILLTFVQAFLFRCHVVWWLMKGDDDFFVLCLWFY